MKLKVISGIVLTLFLTSMLTLAFNIQPVKASGTIYIRADGSIDPPTVNITSGDNVTYTFTDNINDSIVVERDNIVVDGAGCTLQGTGSGRGIDLTGRGNVTVKNIEIKEFYCGIWLNMSSSNTISGNNITNNKWGIYLESFSNSNTISGNDITNNKEFGIRLSWSSNNTVFGNTITENNWGFVLYSSCNNNTISGNTITNNNGHGIWLYKSSNNTIFHNNFVNNTGQAGVTTGYVNTWNNGYPSGGNYWSDYNDTDSNKDGIGDTPYIIDENNTDNYPLMGMFSDFPISSIIGFEVVELEKTYHVTTICNSTITNFVIYPIFLIAFPEEWVGGYIVLDVTGPERTKGFCRFTIPKGLLDCPEGLEYWTVYLNCSDVTSSCNIWENSTHTFIYVPYNHNSGIQEIWVKGTWILPEFPTLTSIMLMLTVLILAATIYKQRLLKTPIH